MSLFGGGRRGAGTGDVNGPASSVDSEVAIFSGTGGKTVKRATGSGIARLISGVLSLISLPGDATKFLDGTGAFSTPAGGIGGSTGSTDNRLLRANGTGGATLQPSPILVGDDGAVSGWIQSTLADLGVLSPTLTADDYGKTCTLDPQPGSSDSFALPSSPAFGVSFRFAIISTDALTVQATGSHKIYIGASVSSAAGSATSSTKGSFLYLEYVGINMWFGIASGSWALA